MCFPNDLPREGEVGVMVNHMKYEDMTAKQKRDYGFVKMTKEQLSIMTSRSGTTGKRAVSASRPRPKLHLIVND